MAPTLSSCTTLHRLALVIGSGGIRSAAALGVAEFLSREGVRPDLLIGCGAGALFGAMQAMRMTNKDARAMADRLWLPELTRYSWRSCAKLIAPKLLGFDRDFSLCDASRIQARIEAEFGERRLESLSTPLRVVTTDTDSGDCVVLSQGSVAAALRAGLASPLLLPSVAIDGRRLSHGVTSNPLPVAVAQDAHAVIALSFQHVMPRRMDRASGLVAQIAAAMIGNLQQAQLLAARATGQRVMNIAIDIDPRIDLRDRTALPHLMAAGRQAAELRWSDIRVMLGDHVTRIA